MANRVLDVVSVEGALYVKNIVSCAELGGRIGAASAAQEAHLQYERFLHAQN